MIDIKNFKFSDSDIELYADETNCGEIAFEVLNGVSYATFDEDDVAAMSKYFDELKKQSEPCDRSELNGFMSVESESNE